MTYLSDWREAEEAAQRARKMNPDCTGEPDCPAPDGVPGVVSTGGHHTSCKRYLRIRAAHLRVARLERELSDAKAEVERLRREDDDE